MFFRALTANPNGDMLLAMTGELAVAKMLVVETDPYVSRVVADGLSDATQAEVDCVATITQAQHMIANRRYDFALIAVMRDYAGFVLAERAANENIPVLLTSGNPFARDRLQRFGFPYLFKPYQMSSLVIQATKIMENVGENIRCVRASAARMMINMEALTAAVTESHRIITESRQIIDSIEASRGTRK